MNREPFFLLDFVLEAKWAAAAGGGIAVAPSKNAIAKSAAFADAL